MATELYKLIVHMNNLDEHSEHTLHFKGDNVTAGLTLTSGEDLIASFETIVLPSWLACCPSSSQLGMLSAQRILPKGSTIARKRYDPGSQQGTVASNASFNQLCPAVRIIPAMGGETINRVFMPAVADSSIDNNAYVAAYVTAIDAVFNLIQATFGATAIVWQQAVFSKKLQTYVLASGWNLSARFGFQRRRQGAI